MPFRSRHLQARDAEAVRRPHGEDESLARGDVPIQARRRYEAGRRDGAQQSRRRVRGERRLRERLEGVSRGAASRSHQSVHSEKLQPPGRVHDAREERSARAGNARGHDDRRAAAEPQSAARRSADAAGRHAHAGAADPVRSDRHRRYRTSTTGRLAMKRFATILALLAIAVSAFAGVMEVKLKLPVKPKLKITGDERIAIAPFIIASKGEKKSDRAAKVDVQSEFNRYLRKQLNKSTKLKIVDVPQTRLPGTDMKSLEGARDYWKDLGARTGADFIVTGIVDFDINDKSGYRTEEYTSPADGRTFYRQVLVESTGFVFDIDLAVFNADTGEMVLEENFRDFKEFDQRNYDEILGLFENLRALETQLVGIFVSQETSAARYMFTE